MDNLQYKLKKLKKGECNMLSFKPYYKWITFNTKKLELDFMSLYEF